MHIEPIQKDYAFIRIHNQALRVQSIRPSERPNKPQPTLVFLHEGLGSIELWKGFPELLVAATGLDAIVYERLGYGQSDPLEQARPMDYLQREALDNLPLVLKELNIERPLLVGHSDGGSIALVYAGAFPTYALISEAAHIFVEPETLAGIEAVKGREDLELLKNKLSKYHGDKTEAIFSAWADTWLHPDFKDWNIESYLQGIACPSLIIQGLEDEYATPLQVERILAAMPSAPYKEQMLPSPCGHSPHLQAKDLVLDKMTAFIKFCLKNYPY